MEFIARKCCISPKIKLAKKKPMTSFGLNINPVKTFRKFRVFKVQRLQPLTLMTSQQDRMTVNDIDTDIY